MPNAGEKKGAVTIKMVTALLRGGLGNQMFQYALGLALARANRTAIKVDTVYLKDRLPRRNYTYRDYDLDIFTMNNTPCLTALSRAAHKLPLSGLWLGVNLVRTAGRKMAGMEKIVREKGTGFDPTILEERGDLLLVGYWQSEKYFAHAGEELRKAFQFKHSLEGLAKDISRQIQSTNSVSIHIRRGDYVALKHVANVVGPTNLAYYQRAAAHMNEHGRGVGNESPTFFVFSDDTVWCRTNLKLPFPTVYLDQASAGPKASHHLQLMSQCRHNIVANSSFSWWGAWLNANPEKIVIAPEQWFANKKSEDIIPQRWIKM